jgi:hypothetical protein
MRNNQEFEHLEALEQYPDGFQDNVKTQSKLLQNAVGRFQWSSKNSKTYRSGLLGLVVKKRVAAILVLLVSVISVYWWALQQRMHQLPRISASANIQQKMLKPVTQSRVAQSQKLKVLPKGRHHGKAELDKEIAQELPATEGFVRANLDTPTTQGPLMSESVAISKQPLFDKKQRFKQFEFQPKKPSAQARKSPPSTEFFVFRDGQFKIVASPSQQQFIQYIKPQ